jgi:hypothetical protein
MTVGVEAPLRTDRRGNARTLRPKSRATPSRVKASSRELHPRWVKASWVKASSYTLWGYSLELHQAHDEVLWYHTSQEAFWCHTS